MVYVGKKTDSGLAILDKKVIYRPTSYQYQIHQDKSRYKFLCSSRRQGKTYVDANEGIEAAITTPYSNNVFLSPIYAQVLNVANIVNMFIPKHLVRNRLEKSREERVEIEKETQQKYLDFKDIQLKNMSVIKFKTCIKPERIKGEGYNFAGLNEAAEMDEKIWYEVMLPALADRRGRAFVESTPKGQNWFYHEWLKGLYPEENPLYKSWRYTCYTSPFISPEDIENLRKTLPDRVFRQEFLAEFLDNAMAVFSEETIRKNVNDKLDYSKYNGTGYILVNEPDKKSYYLIGVDLGQTKDFTVITVFNRNTKKLDAFWRFKYKSYDQIYQSVMSLMNYYKRCEIWIDSTGVGKPTYERLADQYGDLVVPYYFTYQTKKDLIESLQLKLELGLIEMPVIPILLQELKMYSYEMTEGGRLTFNAPKGYHDDCVISLALALRAFESYEWN